MGLCPSCFGRGSPGFRQPAQFGKRRDRLRNSPSLRFYQGEKIARSVSETVHERAGQEYVRNWPKASKNLTQCETQNIEGNCHFSFVVGHAGRSGSLAFRLPCLACVSWRTWGCKAQPPGSSRVCDLAVRVFTRRVRTLPFSLPRVLICSSFKGERGTSLAPRKSGSTALFP
jgi:hypothetical protein